MKCCSAAGRPPGNICTEEIGGVNIDCMLDTGCRAGKWDVENLSLGQPHWWSALTAAPPVCPSLASGVALLLHQQPCKQQW